MQEDEAVKRQAEARSLLFSRRSKAAIDHDAMKRYELRLVCPGRHKHVFLGHDMRAYNIKMVTVTTNPMARIK